MLVLLPLLGDLVAVTPPSLKLRPCPSDLLVNVAAMLDAVQVHRS
jgi:hypothetical protein